MVILCASSLLLSQEAQPTFRIGAELLGGTRPSCPVFIGHASKRSPAAKAGLQPGDRLLGVDGKAVDNVADASRLLSSNTPESVKVDILRAGKKLSLTVAREDSARLWQEQGLKLLQDGRLVKADATESEIEHQQKMIDMVERSESSVAFSDKHYPIDKQAYYPGFEVFILNGGDTVIVGGIENGPASRSGIRYGDEILAINGVDPRRKSNAAIEGALTSDKPALVTLKIARDDTPRSFTVQLEQASAVLRENDKKVVNGRIVPAWLPDEYLGCWQ